MPNPTRVAYNSDLDKFLGVNDDGAAEAYDPEDMPKAVKSGRVVVHMPPLEILSRGDGSDNQSADGGRASAKSPEEADAIEAEGRDEVGIYNRKLQAATPAGQPYKPGTVAPTVPVHLEPLPDAPQRPAEAFTPPPTRPAMPAAPPRADAGSWGGGGGLPGMMAAVGGALGNTVMGASPIPGVRPNSGKASKTAPGAGDLSSMRQALMNYAPGMDYGPGMDDASLQQAQGVARKNQLAAGLERAGTTINAALTNRHPDYSSSNDLERMSGQPVQDILQRRAASDQGLKRAAELQGMQGAQYQRQMQLEMMDPGSERSIRAQQVLQQSNPDFAKRLDLTRMSANDIASLGELGKTVLNHTMELEKADKEKAATNEAAQKREDDRIAAENARHKDSESGEDRRTQWRINAEAARERDRLAAAEHGGKSQRLEDQEAKAMQDDLDPNKGRGSNLALNQRRLDQADRLKALVTEGNGDIRNLDRRQMEELAIGLDSMLSGGGHGAESQVKALVPSTAWGDGAKLKEWLSNDPQGTNQVAFVRRMLETVDRERSVAADQIKSAQIKRLGAHSGLKERNPERYHAILNNYGISPDEESAGKPEPTPTGKTKTVKGQIWEEMSDGSARLRGQS